MAGTGTAHLRPDARPLLAVDDLVVTFQAGRRRSVQAVSSISFDVVAGETLGVVGESGCGKSSAARAVLQLPRPASGRVRFDGVDLTALRGEQLRRIRAGVQLIFQDPKSALNPRQTVRELVGEGLAIWGASADADARVDAALAAVGFDPDAIGGRLPGELSGGQSQRVCIARALVLEPKLLICDEPVSALDVSVQAQVLNLLEHAKAAYGLSMVFISHDLAVVKAISDRVLVMYLGKVCEVGDPDLLYRAPAHPYTALLLASRPTARRADVPAALPDLAVERELPSATAPPSGCRFRTRCPYARERCEREEPTLRAVGGDQWVACHFPLTVGRAAVAA